MGKALACAAVLLMVLGSLPSWGDEYYIYQPAQIKGAQPPEVPDQGVLVKSIRINRGDTLSKLSKRYNRKGYYYPQILLFNRISNPDLIYTGNTLLVPLMNPSAAEAASDRRREAPETTAPLSPPPEKKTTSRSRKRNQPEVTEAPSIEAEQGQILRNSKRTAKPSKPERLLFEDGVKAYRRGDYLKAQKIFDRFLSNYPDSPLAPDATVYRADSYLQQAR